MLRLNDTICVHNLELVILLMLSPLRNESEVKTKIKSVNIKSYSLYIKHLNNQDLFKGLGFLILFTIIYKVYIDICI